MPHDFHPALYAWYTHHGRKELPWRNTSDPYAILVSEVMLQQTQVKTVLARYYFPFLTAFPTLEALASAPREKVLKLWQGLGYYNRAVNLHKAAQQVSSILPDTIEALLALPGIGRNTAHAVASFAYRQPVPVMEANVKRVLHRVFALPQASEKQLWQYAEELLDSSDPFTHNQAMMDIGAMVCTKANPQCLVCPLRTLCKGKENPSSYPAKKARHAIPVRKKNIVVFSSGGYFYVSQRESRFLNGLYGFKEYTKGKPVIFYNQHYAISQSNYVGKVQQTYSHFTLDADVYCIEIESRVMPKQWKTYADIQRLPLSKADEKIMVLIGRNR